VPTFTPRFRIQLSLEVPNLGRPLNLAIEIITFFARDGSRARAFRINGTIEIIVEGVSKEDILSFVKSVGNHLAKEGDDQSITVSAIEGGAVPEELLAGEICHTRLTKKLLSSLSNGAWLLRPGIERTWVQSITENTDRQRAWEQARKSGTANKVVYVLWQETDVRAVTEFFEKEAAAVAGEQASPRREAIFPGRIPGPS
jgi:hypothetical protein